MTPRSLDRKRAARALAEPMEIVATNKTWRFTVRTEHGVYAVDAQAKTCTCKDFRNRILSRRRAGNRDAMCTMARLGRAAREARSALWSCHRLLRVVNGTHLLQAQLVVGTQKRDEWKEAV